MVSTRLASGAEATFAIRLCYCLAVPDDERKRRRMGDDTRARVDDLASGWTIGPDKPPDKPAPAPAGTPAEPQPATKLETNPPKPKPSAPKLETKPPAATPSAPVLEPIPEAPPPTRRKARTVPPPPPGSEARKQLEQAIVDTKDSEPPPEPARPPKPITRPPPIPSAARAKTPSKPDTMFTPERTPPVIIDASLIAENPKLAADIAAGKLPVPTVPIGEFEAPAALDVNDSDKMRVAHAQATIKRDAAEALLQIPEPSTATTVATSPFERGDPTAVGRDDATEIDQPSASKRRATGGTLRAASMLRRKRGIAGDVTYVFTALFGAREARREVAALEARQTLRQTSRKRHLVTLGRTAVTADSFDHPALGKARDALQAVEDERSKHAGAVAASDAELERVRRERDTKAKQFAADKTATEAELAELAKKLEPLEKEAVVARRRASDLKDQLRKIGKQIADTEALLVSVKSEKMDRAGIQADIATLKADQKSVQRDEPAIAAELDALEPRIAAIKAARTEADKKLAELVTHEDEDQRRTTELYDAIGAKRKVVERAAAEAEAARDVVLFELGDRLYVDRPAVLGAQMSPIDQIDLELGETDRRIMELREILQNIDRSKILRGAAVIFAALVVIGAFVAWLLYMLL
jgi:hypothetical protein